MLPRVINKVIVKTVHIKYTWKMNSRLGSNPVFHKNQGKLSNMAVIFWGVSDCL